MTDIILAAIYILAKLMIVCGGCGLLYFVLRLAISFMPRGYRRADQP